MLMGNFIVQIHKVKQNWADAVMTLLSPVNCKFVLWSEFQLEFQGVGIMFLEI